MMSLNQRTNSISQCAIAQLTLPSPIIAKMCMCLCWTLVIYLIEHLRLVNVNLKVYIYKEYLGIHGLFVICMNLCCKSIDIM